MYDQGLIAYSLGIFVFRVHEHEYLQNKPVTDQGFILQVGFSHGENGHPFTYKAIPMKINLRIRLCMFSESSDRLQQLNQLAEFSSGLSKPGLLRGERLVRCKKEGITTLYHLYYTWKRKGFFPRYKTMLMILKSPYERKWIYSLVSFGLLE